VSDAIPVDNITQSTRSTCVSQRFSPSQQECSEQYRFEASSDYFRLKVVLRVNNEPSLIARGAVAGARIGIEATVAASSEQEWGVATRDGRAEGEVQEKRSVCAKNA
jgi:hypothetical protein